MIIIGLNRHHNGNACILEDGKITYEEAIRNAESENNLRLRIKLEGKEAKDTKLGKSIENVGFDDT